MEIDPKSENIASKISQLMNRLHKPVLIACTEWGELFKTESGRKMKNDFIGDFKDFCNFLCSKFKLFIY